MTDGMVARLASMRILIYVGNKCFVTILENSGTLPEILMSTMLESDTYHKCKMV